MAEIVDLRGRELPPPLTPVLADPSGRRALRLARAGRLVAIVFLLWLVGLALAGLGILPASIGLLGPDVGGSGPPAVKALPAVPQPTASGVAPAASAARPRKITTTRLGSRYSQATRSVGGASGFGASHGHRSARHSHGSSATRLRAGSTTIGGGHMGGTARALAGTTGNGVAAGRGAKGNGSARGQRQKQTTPGHTRTATAGNSANASGQTKRVTRSTTTTEPSTTLSRSGAARDQMVLHGGGNSY